MPFLNQLLQNMPDSADRQPIFVGLLVGLLVFTTAMVIAWKARRREVVGRRAAASVGAAGATLDGNWQLHATRLVETAAAVFAQGGKTNVSALEQGLVRAGFFSDHAIAYFGALRLLSAIVLPATFLLLLTALTVSLPLPFVALGALCMTLLGLVLPALTLDYRIKNLQQRYRHAFPDMMDLLVVCVESGQSVQSAIAQVAREMMQVCRPLGFNLHLVSLELRAGSTVNTALIGLHGRVGLDEVKSLAVLMKQSEELGASIAGTLHVFSEEMREKRLIRAETKANLLPVKMTIPLGLFIFPVILLVILVPVIIRIKNSFV